MITIAIDDRAVLAALNDLIGKVSDITPALQDIGEHLTETTKRRFDSSTAPDGSAWAPNTQTTILNYLGGTKGNFKKDGQLSKKGAARQGSKKPLIGESRSLMSTISYAVTGNAVEIGSPMIYAAMQQFGGSKSEFPNLWGDIPARPFLGLSEDDARSILEILSDYLNP